MRLYTTLFLLLLGSNAFHAAHAQNQDIRAVTEDGRKVLLSPDGKWKFDRRTTSLLPSGDSTSPYQTAVSKFSVAFNTAQWNMVPRKDGDESNKRVFQHKSLPVDAMVISDEIPATNEAIKDVMLFNARNAGASTTTLIDRTEIVSGKNVGLLRFAAVMKNIEFVFSTYYYGDGDGNIQVTCYTGQALFFKYENDCQQFLNGLRIK